MTISLKKIINCTFKAEKTKTLAAQNLQAMSWLELRTLSLYILWVFCQSYLYSARRCDFVLTVCAGEMGPMVASTLKLGIAILNGGNSTVQQVTQSTCRCCLYKQSWFLKSLPSVQENLLQLLNNYKWINIHL